VDARALRLRCGVRNNRCGRRRSAVPVNRRLIEVLRSRSSMPQSPARCSRNHGARLARLCSRVNVPPTVWSGNRRHRLSLRRADRCGRFQDAAGVFISHYAAIMQFWMVFSCGRDRLVGPSGMNRWALWKPYRDPANRPGRKAIVAVPESDAHDDALETKGPGKRRRRGQGHARISWGGAGLRPNTDSADWCRQRPPSSIP